ncbi:MAG: hypothetical protein IKI75_01765 [Lachnospiraceae bacterium]|nr:hypothetical protein [Lachnospiraceae bacterium]
MKNDEKGYLTYTLAGLLSFICFLAIYGAKILNPAYTDWLQYDAESVDTLLRTSGDLTQHYQGFVAYRAGSWQFPIGLTDMLANPGRSSVIFTDSIPLLAVIFKLLSPVLPETFQYMGLWGAFCFIMHGMISALIFRRHSKDVISVCSASLLMLISPVLLFRLYGHEALGAQWILLYFLEILYSHDKYEEGKRLYGRIAVGAVLASSVHMYFLLMAGMIVCGISLDTLLRSKKLKRAILLPAEYIAVSVTVLLLLGAFSGSGSHYSFTGLGYHSLNLNGLFNSQGWSLILPPLSFARDGQYEGFGYMGLGAGLCFLYAFAVFIFTKIRDKEKKLPGLFFPLLFVFAVSFFFALSPLVTLGDRVLFELKLPGIVFSAWSVFRSTGRIVMLSVYVLELSALIFMLKTAKRPVLNIMLPVCVVLQFTDISGILREKHEIYTAETIYRNPLDDDIWKEIGEDVRIKHVVFGFNPDHDAYHFAQWALSYDMSLSDYSLAHHSGMDYEERLKKSLSGDRGENVYIIENGQSSLFDPAFYSIEEADGFIIALPLYPGQAAP